MDSAIVLTTASPSTFTGMGLISAPWPAPLPSDPHVIANHNILGPATPTPEAPLLSFVLTIQHQYFVAGYLPFYSPHSCHNCIDAQIESDENVILVPFPVAVFILNLGSLLTAFVTTFRHVDFLVMS